MISKDSEMLREVKAMLVNVAKHLRINYPSKYPIISNLHCLAYISEAVAEKMERDRGVTVYTGMEPVTRPGSAALDRNDPIPQSILPDYDSIVKSNRILLRGNTASIVKR